jgi:hypothetical protein
MLAHIKERPDGNFDSGVLVEFQKRIDGIIETVESEGVKDKLGRALELLRGPNNKSEDERARLLLNFYEQHYI